mmetsp:Transcript_128834/g.226912  ORF Transcript_128834/g.226912 Transcript_128834/m.226912 type:complete len:223 (-) Transcript_128834:292-960(-)
MQVLGHGFDKALHDLESGNDLIVFCSHSIDCLSSQPLHQPRCLLGHHAGEGCEKRFLTDMRVWMARRVVVLQHVYESRIVYEPLGATCLVKVLQALLPQSRSIRAVHNLPPKLRVVLQNNRQEHVDQDQKYKNHVKPKPENHDKSGQTRPLRLVMLRNLSVPAKLSHKSHKSGIDACAERPKFVHVASEKDVTSDCKTQEDQQKNHGEMKDIIRSLDQRIRD